MSHLNINHSYLTYKLSAVQSVRQCFCSPSSFTSNTLVSQDMSFCFYLLLCLSFLYVYICQKKNGIVLCSLSTGPVICDLQTLSRRELYTCTYCYNNSWTFVYIDIYVCSTRVKAAYKLLSTKYFFYFFIVCAETFFKMKWSPICWNKLIFFSICWHK